MPRRYYASPRQHDAGHLLRRGLAGASASFVELSRPLKISNASIYATSPEYALQFTLSLTYTGSMTPTSLVLLAAYDSAEYSA